MFRKSYNQRASGDRFIPRRAKTDFDISNILLSENRNNKESINKEEHDENRYINNARINYKREEYKEKLWSMIVPTQSKILNFSEPKRKCFEKKRKSEVAVSQMWPVKPRKMPLITAPIMVLDMPDLRINYCHHITDWGKKGYLASIFEKEVYLWDPNTNVPRILSETGGCVENCVRWNTDGTQFAMALVFQAIAVWDLKTSKIIHENMCHCSGKCTITAIDWSGKSANIVSGCTNGRLCIWTPKLVHLESIYAAHDAPIITICFSSCNSYLATSGFEGTIRIWFWKDMQPNFEITGFAPVRGIAWHPWEDSLLAIGCSVGGLTLWNASSTHQRRNFLPHEFSCDTLTWSEITGELVVSLWDKAENRNTILVLSSFEIGVDAIQWHSGRVLYLLWGPDGTQLASAGADENLCVWEFLGTSRKYKTPKKKATESYIFGKCIR